MNVLKPDTHQALFQLVQINVPLKPWFFYSFLRIFQRHKISVSNLRNYHKNKVGYNCVKIWG